jgi:hypothetical protein
MYDEILHCLRDAVGRKKSIKIVRKEPISSA